MELKINEWNESYKQRDNYIFYPHEEIIRFISKYIRKRIGLNEFIDICENASQAKILDFGCGIGRHIKLLDEFQLNGFGFDISAEAICTAKNNFDLLGLTHLKEKIVEANIIDLPYKNGEFSFMLSHGVLDSMPFVVAKKGMHELYRILKTNGFIYFDLISNKYQEDKTSDFEEIVRTQHEKGTIQSFFNDERINSLLQNKFKIIECYQIEKVDLINASGINSRYHVIVQKVD
ncbi:MAG: class I SAM-dependent methyltransferase [Spirochaetia bacterium]|nr:class I SAM-dependent methyltransferase [Spirochaetia bacterium]